MPILHFLLCWLLLTATSAFSQRLYVFAVVDPDPRYKPDADRLHRMADSLSQYGRYELHWYGFATPQAFSARIVRATVDSFQPADADRDVIWFHYAGRGYSDGPNAWPTFRFGNQHLAVRDVLASLRAKPVRTLLVTADCANQLRPTPLTSTAPIPPNRPSVVVKPRITNVQPVISHDTTMVSGYRRLMQVDRVRQIIVMSAASHGQRAYRTVRQGSVWLARLDTVMDSLVRTNPTDLSWKRIQEHVARLTREKTQHRQTPQYNRQTRTCCESKTL